MSNSHRRVSAPWFAVPRGDMAFRHGLLAVLFALFFLLFYGGASALSSIVPYRVSVEFSFEVGIPYHPLAALIYISMIVMLCLAPFLLRTWQQMWTLFSVLAVETLIAVVFFVFLPVEATPAVPQGPGFLASVYAFAETINMERNELPSLHVAYAITTALCYRSAHGKAAGLVFGTWAIAIAVSTLFMKEHYLLDVVTGIALAYLCWHYCRHPLSTAARLSRIDIELIAIREMITFSKRHRRYATIMLAIYIASLFGWRKRRILRTGFATLQWVDDLLDNDRPATEAPEITASRVIKQLGGTASDNRRLSRLTIAMAEDLTDEGRALAIELIQVMCSDHKRMTDQTQLRADHLQTHLKKTFILSFDLFMQATNLPLRSGEFPDLIQALSWCSMERDLDEDLKHGLINIPAEVIGGQSFTTPIELLKLPHVQQWRQVQRSTIIPVLDRLDSTLATEHRPGAGVLRLFARSIRKYATA